MFLPLLAAAGGNTGSQSITLVIRALALGEIDVSLRDAILVVWKELRVAVLLAAVLGCVAYGRIWVQGAVSDEVFSPRIGLAVALAMGIQVVSSMVLGALLPLCSARFKLDPAVVASPALTTAVDVTGLLIYFGVVSLLLGG
jgi:magnesium transporter